MQGAAVLACRELGVEGGGLGERALFGEGNDEVEFGVEALEAGEVHAREGDGADAFGADELGELADGEEGEPLGRLVRGGGVELAGEEMAYVGRFAQEHGLLRGVEDHGAGNGIEDEGRGDGVGQGELADLGDVVALVVEAVEHDGLLGVVDVHAGDGGGVVDHVGGDLWCGSGVGVRTADSGRWLAVAG